MYDKQYTTLPLTLEKLSNRTCREVDILESSNNVIWNDVDDIIKRCAICLDRGDDLFETDSA